MKRIVLFPTLLVTLLLAACSSAPSDAMKKDDAMMEGDKMMEDKMMEDNKMMEDKMMEGDKMMEDKMMEGDKMMEDDVMMQE